MTTHPYYLSRLKYWKNQFGVREPSDLQKRLTNRAKHLAAMDFRAWHKQKQQNKIDPPHNQQP